MVHLISIDLYHLRNFLVLNSYYLFHLSICFIFHQENINFINLSHPILQDHRDHLLLIQRLNQLALVLFLLRDLWQNIWVLLFIYCFDFHLQSLFHFNVISVKNFHHKLIDWLRMFYIDQVVEWIYVYKENQIILNTFCHKKLLEQGFDISWKF